MTSSRFGEFLPCFTPLSCAAKFINKYSAPCLCKPCVEIFCFLSGCKTSNFHNTSLRQASCTRLHKGRDYADNTQRVLQTGTGVRSGSGGTENLIARLCSGVSPKTPLPYGAGGKGETDGGLPPAGATCSIDDFDYQIKYQRALEAVLWNMPAVAIYSFRRAAFEHLGVKDNDIIAYSKPATPHLEAITANSTTPYISAFTDLQKGPVVLDVPAAGADGSVYGQIVDAWQFTIADVGPAGLDKGKGGKFLLTPPGYDGAIPAGYLHVPSPNYRVAFAFRSVPAAGKTADDAYRYSKRMRMYYLADAANRRRNVLSTRTINVTRHCLTTMNAILMTCIPLPASNRYASRIK